MFSTLGDHEYSGGYHEYRGGVFSTVGGYHEYTGGYHDKCGGRLSPRVMSVQYTGRCSVHWEDIMNTVGDIMSTLWGYHEYTRGDIMINVGEGYDPA